MIKLLDILKETVQEASLEKDVNKDKETKDIINKVNSAIRSGKAEVSKVAGHTMVTVDLPDIKFRIFNAPTNDRTRASFSAKSNPPTINVFDAKIDDTSKPMNVKFDEDEVRHELVHYLDFRNSSKGRGIFKDKSRDFEKKSNAALKQRGNTNKSYFNSPFEINAHFFEYFMPEVLKFLQKEKELPVNAKSFVDSVISNPKGKEFYDQLDDKNKQKVMKRLGTYYDLIKNPASNVVHNGNIDVPKLKKTTDSFISKLKQKLGFKKAA